MDMTFDRHRDCGCNHFGVITSYVDRINDVPIYLARFGVIDLTPYLRIDEKMKAFSLYGKSIRQEKANSSCGNLLRLVPTQHRVAKARGTICFMDR